MIQRIDPKEWSLTCKCALWKGVATRQIFFIKHLPVSWDMSASRHPILFQTPVSFPSTPVYKWKWSFSSQFESYGERGRHKFWVWCELMLSNNIRRVAIITVTTWIRKLHSISYNKIEQRNNITLSEHETQISLLYFPRAYIQLCKTNQNYNCWMRRKNFSIVTI